MRRGALGLLMVGAVLTGCASTPPLSHVDRNVPPASVDDLADVMAQIVAIELPPATSIVSLDSGKDDAKLSAAFEDKLRADGFGVQLSGKRDAKSPTTTTALHYKVSMFDGQGLIRLEIGKVLVTELVAFHENGRIKSMAPRTRAERE